ncbi:hypothetical protein D3C74_370990 [compost metagenome]
MDSADGEAHVPVERPEQALARAEEQRCDGQGELVDQAGGEERLDRATAVDVDASRALAVEELTHVLDRGCDVDAWVVRAKGRAQDDDVLAVEGPLVEAEHRLVGGPSHDHGVDGREERLPHERRRGRRRSDVIPERRSGEPVEAAVGACDETVQADADEDASGPLAGRRHVHASMSWSRVSVGGEGRRSTPRR